MKIKNIYILFTILILGSSCNNTEEDNSVLNESDKYAECNSILTNCTNGNGRYCLFGYKWGSSGMFSPAGFNATGPKEKGGEITYSFQESNGLVNTHAQIDLPSKSFDEILDCAKSEIRKSIEEWSSHANLEFVESSENSNSDIRFFVADIRQSGVGFPNFQESPCNFIGGDIIISSDLELENCSAFHAYILHEIGHSLGLGHVTTQNIMNSKVTNLDITELQEGDIEGVIELYGPK